MILFFIGEDRREEKVFTLVFQKPSKFRNILYAWMAINPSLLSKGNGGKFQLFIIEYFFKKLKKYTILLLEMSRKKTFYSENNAQCSSFRKTPKIGLS